MAKTPEGEVSKYARDTLKKHGCVVRKISYEGRRGCPDLLVQVPRYPLGGKEPPSGQAWIWLIPKTLLLEIKKDEHTGPDPHQQREHARLKAAGADVRTIGSKAQVDELVEELFPV